MAKAKNIDAPNWTNKTIIAAAAKLMGQYEEIVGRDHILRNGLHFDEFYEKLLFPKFETALYEDDDLGFDQDGQKFLGRFEIRKNAAHLDRVISRESHDPRRIFTCWHEIAGHAALQGQWLRQQLENGSGDEVIEVTEHSFSSQAIGVLERQANLFASRLAAPDWLINYAINTTFRPSRRFLFMEPCIYGLSSDGWSHKKYIVDAGDLAGWIGSQISQFFGGLSAEAIGYRIREIGWIEDRTKPDVSLFRAARNIKSSKVLMSA